MKKVLFITNNKKFGGSEVLWIKLAYLLLDRGYKIGIATFPWKQTPDIFQQLIRNKNVEVFYRQKLHFNISIFDRIYRRITNHRQVWESFHPDFAIISLGSHLTTMNQPHYCMRAGIPYSIIFQIVTENSVEGNPRYCEEIAGATLNYFASRQNRDILERQVAQSISNSKVVYNSFQVNDDVPFHWPIDQNTLNMAVVCRLDSFHKGLDLLFEVLRQNKWKERNIRIRIYGDGFSKKYLLKLSEYYGLSLVSFEGHQNNIEEIWATNQALILPSRHEGMSLALIEAMLIGRVCIATDVGGGSELLQHGINGFIASAPLVKYIDNALEDAWQARDEWKAIGFAAFNTIRQKLDKKPEVVISEDVDRLLREK